jgi:phosphoribosylformimino-5-aminoimidazole carboxamide ribotide isomerase
MIEIIPAIDIIDGKCVRLSQGDFDTKRIYNEYPLEVAKRFESAGIKRLHLVDLDGAKDGKMVNINVLQEIASQTNLQIDYSGGIKNSTDIAWVFDAGAAFVCIGSMSVKQPDVFYDCVEAYGNDKIILGADVKERKIAISGWKEQTDLDIIQFLNGHIKQGINRVLCTDVSKDGMLQGVAIELYKSIIKTFPDIKLIASGGVSVINDIVALEVIGCASVVIGKAIYTGSISLKELEKYTG